MKFDAENPLNENRLVTVCTGTARLMREQQRQRKLAAANILELTHLIREAKEVQLNLEAQQEETSALLRHSREGNGDNDTMAAG